MNNTPTEYLPASNSFKTFYSGVSAVKIGGQQFVFLANKLLFEIDDQFKVIPIFWRWVILLLLMYLTLEAMY